MDKPKPNLGKSKSSNATLSTKENRNKNKKTLSNAEFQSKMLKKRGVYVEKKVTSTNLDVKDKKDIDETILKPQPRRRPGKKKFLNSVLTILSKSTAGTQYDLESERPKKTRNKIKKGFSEYDETNAEATASNVCDGINKKKKKYKSKILNDRLNDNEQIVILSSKKDIVQTPSIYSDRSNVEIKWADFPRLVKTDDECVDKKIDTAIYNCVADGMSKSGKRVTIDTEPRTLVSDKPDDKLFNFFVDLLETTFDNVTTEVNKVSSISSSKVTVKRNESVVKKFEVSEDSETNVTNKYCCIDNHKDEWDDVKLLEHFQTKPVSVKLSEEGLPLKFRRKKRKVNTNDRMIMNTQSFVLPKRKSNIKYKKNNLLTLFKEQLMVDALTFEEPENLYQALKVMAKNKRKHQNSIQFDRVTRFADSNTECRFRRRKVISATKKSNKKPYNPESELLKSITSNISENTEFSVKVDGVTDYKHEFDESMHSLEVVGYNFDNFASRRENDKKEMLFANSLSSMSDGETVMKYI